MLIRFPLVIENKPVKREPSAWRDVAVGIFAAFVVILYVLLSNPDLWGGVL